jgi:S1-C subfamily serine protease
MGDSDNLQVGQRVLAIGNPFGFQSTLTTGVVSALGRTVQTGQTTVIDGAIQTDAAINQGNSGGPLLNSHGEVIGINSAIYTPSGTTAGIGFAIPISTARLIAQDLITEGRVRRATMGVEARVISPAVAEELKLPVREGLLIERVTPGGPADHAGLRGGNRTAILGMRRILLGGDVVTGIDGRPITEQVDLNLALNRKRPGDIVKVEFYRGGQKMDAQVTLSDGASR